MDRFKLLVQRAVMPLIFAIAIVLASTVQAGSADAAPAAPDPPFSPLYCFQMNMNDGLIFWTYRRTAGGRNYYYYRVRYTSMWGRTSCENNPQSRPGYFHPDFKTCTYAGVSAAVGAFIPGVGVVNSVFFFTTTCGIAILT